jgi:acyl-coenzyme A synthetase/AMP-(fatty) acid ligase
MKLYFHRAIRRRILNIEIMLFQVQRQSYKIANFFRAQGYQKGDTVCLFMGNRPEYACVWLGLGRVSRP